MVVVEVGGHGVRVRGPFEGLVGRFDAALAVQGFTAKSRVNQARLLAHLSRWLEVHVVTPGRRNLEDHCHPRRSHRDCQDLQDQRGQDEAHPHHLA